MCRKTGQAPDAGLKISLLSASAFLQHHKPQSTEMLPWPRQYLFACAVWWRMHPCIWTLGRLLLLLLVVMLERQQLCLIFGEGSVHLPVVLHIFHLLKAESDEPQRQWCLGGQPSCLLKIVAFQRAKWPQFQQGWQKSQNPEQQEEYLAF